MADAVASAVLRRYASLPKHGKPQPGEYTLLAGFAVTDDAVPDAPPRVVALGTGTKCLPASSRCPRGEALSDSHAEVIARRAFVRFLYDELERATSDDGDGETKRDATDANASTRSVPIVEWVATTTTTTPFRLRGGVRVHLYATQSPCGDASIFELADARESKSVAPADVETADGETPKERFPTALFRAENAGAGRAPNKRAKTSSSGGSGSGAGSFFLGATGAKVFESCEVSIQGIQGSREALRVDAERGVAGQRLGACRLKPGRGAQTDCMSCSDKIARWVALGVQGALPSSLISRRSDHLESSHASHASHGTDVGTFETFETYGAVRLASVVVASPSSSEYREDRENDDFGRSTRRAVLDALRRALVDRVGFCVPTRDAPGVFVAAPAPPELSSSAGQARGWVASGTSLNWYWRENRESAPVRKKNGDGGEASGAEVTLGGTGRKAGFPKKARGSRKAQSRLCRASLAARYAEVMACIRARLLRETNRRSAIEGRRDAAKNDENETSFSYETLKRFRAGAYAERDAAFRAPPSPFARWSAKDPEVGRKFEVTAPSGSF